MSFAETIDNWRPYNGPCLLCGYWDQRHRMIECIRGRVNAGEKILDLVVEYQITERVIQAMMRCRIDRRRYVHKIPAWLATRSEEKYYDLLRSLLEVKP